MRLRELMEALSAFDPESCVRVVDDTGAHAEIEMVYNTRGFVGLAVDEIYKFFAEGDDE